MVRGTINSGDHGMRAGGPEEAWISQGGPVGHMHVGMARGAAARIPDVMPSVASAIDVWSGWKCGPGTSADWTAGVGKVTQHLNTTLLV